MEVKTKRRIMFVALFVLAFELVIPSILGLMGIDFLLFGYVADTKTRAILVTIAVLILWGLHWEEFKAGMRGLSRGKV